MQATIALPKVEDCPLDAYRLRRFVQSTYQWRIKTFGGPTPVLVLAHMRSGSTLLSHLLAASPKINAMGEQNVTYSSQEQLDELAARVYAMTLHPRVRHRYVVDQINHNRYTPQAELLHGVPKIVLVRDPYESIPSMLRLFADRWYWDAEIANKYLCERLAGLSDLIRSDRRDMSFALTYADLVDSPHKVLGDIARFLNLDAPLRADYGSQAFTGIISDSSDSIKSGVIRRPEHDDRGIDAQVRPGTVKRYADFVTEFSFYGPDSSSTT